MTAAVWVASHVIMTDGRNCTSIEMRQLSDEKAHQVTSRMHTSSFTSLAVWANDDTSAMFVFVAEREITG